MQSKSLGAAALGNIGKKHLYVLGVLEIMSQCDQGFYLTAVPQANSFLPARIAVSLFQQLSCLRHAQWA